MFKKRTIKTKTLSTDSGSISQKRKRPTVKLDDPSLSSSSEDNNENRNNSSELDSESENESQPVLKRRVLSNYTKHKRQINIQRGHRDANESSHESDPDVRDKDTPTAEDAVETIDDFNSKKIQLKQKMFKTDTLQEEEYKIHDSKVKSEREKKHLQSKDADGDKIYSGRLKQQNSTSAAALKPNPKNIKVSTKMDFQADVCKDFLKNGYCGFGDTCKFLHYRDAFHTVKSNKKREWEDVAKRHKKF
ncbi:unnamed protein product [Ambrosiozyma monospora]|uniref:Unnamed protein product n=1 Tax=Ambrosiozyma monospora TaxID=43982 RepID=A0ACB5ST25_AMBMO|nr:unnamed protein product [Ambrosiozyma monospora]